MVERASDPGFSWASRQLMLRGFVIAGFSYVLMAYDWSLLTGPALAAAVGLLMAGLCGLAGAWQGRRSQAWPLRLADGGLDMIFAGVMVFTGLTSPASSVDVFGLWTVLIGLVLIVHALPSRFRDHGPRWAWVWTGIFCALTGAFTWLFRGVPDATVAQFTGAFGLIAATLVIVLGMDLSDPEVLAMPDQESPAESHHRHNEITYRPTAPDKDAA